MICIMHTIDAPVSQPMPRAKPTRPKTRTPESDRLFLLLGLGALDLGRATQSLLTVLALLACSPDKSVLMWSTAEFVIVIGKTYAAVGMRARA